jgi:hypothetical protein
VARNPRSDSRERLAPINPHEGFTDIREKFTKLRITAKKVAAEYFQRFPKERYQTEVENWCELQSQNIEFTMKRLREPIERATEIAK